MSESDSVAPCQGDALVVVDVQRDFLPGGRLGVPGGGDVVPVLNVWLRRFRGAGLPVVATRDWHPERHCSFVEQGGTWPPHCVAGTDGAEFAPGLRLPEDCTVVSKATVEETDAYSAFQGTGLEGWLRERGVGRVFVGGLATDYCVLETVRDARRAGFRVVLLRDAVRAVDANPGDGGRAVTEMAALGARLADVDDAA